MIEETGARLQESLRVHPATKHLQTLPYPIKGTVQAVYYHDSTGNYIGQTVVDIELMGGYPRLMAVPLCTGKINVSNGEEWTPDPGDGVVVQFINGNWNDPLVTGYFRLPNNEIQASKADAPDGKRRYHMRCNKTDIVIDKDGNRITTVEKNETRHVKIDETLTIDGKRTTIIEGNDETTINSGDLKITVSSGKCTVHIAGKTAWTSDGTIEMDGGSGSPKGVVQGDSVCAYTGKPHAHISATVKASK